MEVVSTVFLNVTVARSVARLTDAVSTPGTALIAFSTRTTHEAHDIPSIPNSVGMGRAVDFSILDMAVMG
jgi:hypothetical protein